MTNDIKNVKEYNRDLLNHRIYLIEKLFDEVERSLRGFRSHKC